MAARAEDRKFHYTYRVTCAYNGRTFFGFRSTDSLTSETKFTGTGHSLSISKREHGAEQHVLHIIGYYPTRKEAKNAFNELKASQLLNPVRPENKKFHVLYKTTRFDGKYYIGVHSTDNLEDGYMGSGTYIGRSLKKHGRDKHKTEILMLCRSRARAFQCEAIAICSEFVTDPLCMNKIKGGRQHGDRVYGDTEETKLKRSQAQRGKVRTPEMRLKYSAAKKGILFTDEHRSKLSAVKSGKPLSNLQRENHANGQAGRCTVDGGLTIYASKTALAKELGHGKAGARSPNFQYVDADRWIQSTEQRGKTRLRMLGKTHNWKRT